MKSFNKQILEAILKGINIALDDYEDLEILILKNSSVRDLNLTKELVELYDIVVDLGLPSGTLWCKYNLGETAITLGDYYAWGETKPKEIYDWDTYEHGYGPYSLYKYVDNSDNAADDNDNKTDIYDVLLHEDDAAYLNIHLYNFKFHIPTKELFDELLKYTTIEYKRMFDEPTTTESAIWLISKINGNKILFPFGLLKGRDILFAGGFYWSSSLVKNWNNHAYHLTVGSDFAKVEHTEERYCGMLIKPVINL